MKNTLIACILLTMLLSLSTAANVAAHPWRGHRHGYWHRPVVRVFAPVVSPRVVVGGYYGPRYYDRPYYPAPRYYGREYGYRGYYRHRYHHHDYDHRDHGYGDRH